MWKDKSPGVKILWIWTIGTAAVLVANVATTRMRDLEKLMDNQEEQTQTPPEQINTSPNPNHNDVVVGEE
ncbi:hypothetical protein LguiA_022034 [Lonicera macranthoides]